MRMRRMKLVCHFCDNEATRQIVTDDEKELGIVCDSHFDMFCQKSSEMLDDIQAWNEMKKHS